MRESLCDEFQIGFEDFRVSTLRLRRAPGAEVEREHGHSRLTLFTHGTSSPSWTLAAELSTLVLAGAAVEAGVRAAGIPRPVVSLGAGVGHGAGRRERVGGDGRGGGGGGERRGVRGGGRSFPPAVERPARGARRAAGDEGGGCLRSHIRGCGGGGSRRRD